MRQKSPLDFLYLSQFIFLKQDVQFWFVTYLFSCKSKVPKVFCSKNSDQTSLWWTNMLEQTVWKLTSLVRLRVVFIQRWGINRLPGAPSGRCAWWWTGLPRTPTPHPLHSSSRTWCTPVFAAYSAVQNTIHRKVSKKHRNSELKCGMEACRMCCPHL